MEGNAKNNNVKLCYDGTNREKHLTEVKYSRAVDMNVCFLLWYTGKSSHGQVNFINKASVAEKGQNKALRPENLRFESDLNP